MKHSNPLINNLIIKINDNSKNCKPNQKYLKISKKQIQNFQKEDQTISKMFLTDELKENIKKTFEHVCEKVKYEIDFSLSDYVYEDIFFEEIIERAKEEITNNFQNYDSWIGYNDFDSDEEYDELKKQIISFINQL